MATQTATLLIGGSHPNHGGINPTHSVHLLENSKPQLVLEPAAVSPGQRGLVWIPTLETMLEDALLMIALHVIGILKLQEMAPQLMRVSGPVYLYDVMEPAELAKLHTACRRLFPQGAKLVITLMEGSALMHHVEVLEHYPFEVELCMPRFSRTHNAWSGKTEVKGSLSSQVSQ